jgi:hypothetical protein
MTNAKESVTRYQQKRGSTCMGPTETLSLHAEALLSCGLGRQLQAQGGAVIVQMNGVVCLHATP